VKGEKDDMGVGDSRRLTIIEGTAVPVPGQDIDTDRIIPARFLKAISFEGIQAHVFEDDRQQALEQGRPHPFDIDAYHGASFLLVNRNFGCGSSREHAPQALKRWGIRAVVGESFSEIFFGNSLAIGMPCVAVPSAEANALIAEVERAPSTPLRLDIVNLTLTAGGRTIPVSMPKPAHEALISGVWDATGMLLDDPAEVEAVSKRLPYVVGF
jgi:3-isopropylmalate/(R)-2-methylmalate dehydratase small subunit